MKRRLAKAGALGRGPLFNALTMVAVFGALVLGAYFVAQLVVLRGFDSVDRVQGRENGLRLRFALRAQVLQLEDIAINWADWTAAYDYVRARTPKERAGFQTGELSDASLLALDGDVFAYLGNKGERVFAASINHAAKTTFAAPAGFEEAVGKSGLIARLATHPTQSAIVAVRGAPMLIGLQRVHRSGHPEQWEGAIVVGRWVGAGVKKSLQEQLRLLITLGAPAPRQEVRIGALDLKTNSLDSVARAPIALAEEGSDLRIETLFSDPLGRTVLRASALMPRAARAQGETSLRSFLATLLGLGAVSLLVALSLLGALSRADAARARESELFDLLTRHLPDRLFIRDLSDKRLRVYGDAPGDPTRDWLDEALLPDERPARRDWLLALSESGARDQREWDVCGATWLEMVTPVRQGGAAAPVSHLIGAAIDISGRKRAEREKDVLLKEIHHRVKNNLQIVVSLLNLQSDAMTDPQARAGFEDARARVRSMALIHEQLYRQSDLSHVDFGAYLSSLLNLLLRSYRRAPVRLEAQLDPVPLDIDIAVPCGLIVTELVSNSFKHAFGATTQDAPARGGELRVHLCTTPRGCVSLRIEDDGPGLPADFCLEESESLGLQIVDSLATQIGARIESGRGPNGCGTRWTLEFEAVESSSKRIESAVE